MKHTIQVVITEKELDIRVRELGQEITKKYKNSKSKMILNTIMKM